MTSWPDTSNQVDRSLYIQPLLGVYCSSVDTSSALNTCEYFIIPLCMPFLWAPLYFFVYLGLEVKRNQFSSNNSHHTSCIHKGSHAGKWPDLITSKPDFGIPVHWDTTGQTTLEVHKCTGMPLEPHWLMLAPSGVPVAIQCLFAYLEHTGRPLEPEVHWDATGTTLTDSSTQWCPNGDQC